MIEITSIPFEQFSQGWIQLALMAAGAIAANKKKKAEGKAIDKSNEINAQYDRESNEKKNEQFYAQMEADMKQMASQTEAGRAMLNARNDAFNLTKEAGDSEEDQEEKFAAALKDFGLTSKEASLEAAKQKRGAAASGAAKGAKINSTGGRAGRLSGAFRSGVNRAVKSGISEAAHTSGQMGSMSGYDEDLNRERAIYGELSNEGRRVGDEAKRMRNLGEYRERLGGAESSAISTAGNMVHGMDSMKAKQLGRIDPQISSTIRPDYGIWSDLGNAAAIGSAAYSMGGNRQGVSDSGSVQMPRGYTLPNRTTRQFQGY